MEDDLHPVTLFFRRDAPLTQEELDAEFAQMSCLEWIRARLAHWAECKMVYKHVEWTIRADTARALGDRMPTVSMPRNGLSPGPHAVVGSACIYHENVFLQWRTYTSEEYEIAFVLNLGLDDITRMLAYADWARANCVYAHPMYQTFLAPVPPNYREFFCTQYVITALQQGGVCRDLNPSETSGDDLLAYLRMFHPHLRPRYPSVPIFLRNSRANGITATNTRRVVDDGLGIFK